MVIYVCVAQTISKAAEGHLAYKLFKKAKEEWMGCTLNWQDQDPSSGNSFRNVFADGNLSCVMLCGGHLGRSHANSLKASLLYT